MNKKYYLFFTLSLILFSYIFNVDRIISNRISTFTYTLKQSYINNTTILSDIISKHFYQEKQIIKLKQQILDNEQNYLYNITQKDTNNSIQQIKVLSYKDFNNFSKVILDPNIKLNHISALLTKNGYSAGIALKQDNQNIAYLNHHRKSNYAVFIGENKVPGITHGNKHSELITIKFIPAWKNIKVNDEVITSGMDNIFSYGIKVGKVVKIKKLSNILEAQVKPYANIYSQTYFYLDINN